MHAHVAVINMGLPTVYKHYLSTCTCTLISFLNTSGKPIVKVTSVSLTPTSVTVEWDLVQGDVITVSLGHKTSTARARRDVSDYKILRDDIDPTERVVTVSGDFDLSVDNVFVVFVYEGNLTQPTGESGESQGTAKAEGRQY